MHSLKGVLLGDMVDTFLTLAEISVGFAGFASIVVIFQRRELSEWSSFDTAKYTAMLRGSLFACGISVAPAILLRSGLTSHVAWSVVSAVFMGYMLYVLWKYIRSDSSQRQNTSYFGLLSMVAIVLLQLLNLAGIGFQRGPAPVLMGLGILLLNVGIAFYHLASVTTREPELE